MSCFDNGVFLAFQCAGSVSCSVELANVAVQGSIPTNKFLNSHCPVANPSAAGPLVVLTVAIEQPSLERVFAELQETWAFRRSWRAPCELREQTVRPLLVNDSDVLACLQKHLEVLRIARMFFGTCHSSQLVSSSLWAAACGQGKTYDGRQ